MCCSTAHAGSPLTVMWKEALMLALAEDVCCAVGHHVGAVVVVAKLLTANVVAVAVAVPPTIINHLAALLSIVGRLI